MVRAQAKESSEDKKETPKKKLPTKKKNVATGVWPCKINGCNKQFAREADLKRHQRTTKLHSMPGFACPQCDATFTRTDALRRHQKSRHNGIVIEPTDNERKDGEGEGGSGSGSKSRSRSGSPLSKGKEKITTVGSEAPVQTPMTGPAVGTSSYYRQHTATTSGYPPRPPQSTDGQFTGVALPTSATRLHQANWSHSPPWPEGQPPPMGYHTVPGAPPLFYPSLYYRPPNGVGPHTQPSPLLIPNPQTMQNGHASSESPPHDPSVASTPVISSQQDVKMGSSGSHTPNAPDEKPTISAVPVIDPSLDSSSSLDSRREPTPHRPLTGEEIKAISFEITQAAMEAVIQSTQRVDEVENRAASRAPVGDPIGLPEAASVSDSRHLTDEEADADGDEADDDDERAITKQLSSTHDTHESIMHGYGPPLDRPEPMEHMLTEDGEPMLNPAELLTQESLASPPPS